MMKKRYILFIVIALCIVTAVGCKKNSQKDDVNTSQTEKTENENKAENENKTKDEVTEETNEKDDVPSWNGMDPGYDENPNYDKLAMLRYNWKEPKEEVYVIVSAMEDNSRFECHFNLGEEEQLAVVTYADNMYTVESDKTGKVSNEVVEMCKKLVDAGEWVEIPK